MSSEHTIADGDYSGWRLRVRAGSVEAKGPEDTRWSPAPLRPLARAYGVGVEPWPWLLVHGIWRPSPSGRTRTDSERGADGKKRIVVWLTADEVEALDRRRKGRSYRDTIGALLLQK